jgi:perosamine synthetase
MESNPQKKLTGEELIPLSVPFLGGNEWKYMKECLDTNYVSSVGPFVNRFESMIADYLGIKHAVACVNGTSALHVALLVSGVKPEEEVLVSSLTFIAPVNAIRYVGAWPVFVDAEADFWQMDSQKLADFLEKKCRWQSGKLLNRDNGRRIRAILPVHILGHPVDIDPIIEVAREYDLVVIEDATECLGARYKDKMTGTIGDISCFSFNGNKIITTGGGGMIVTANSDWARRARYLTTQAKDDPIEYIHNEIGFNFRMTNIQAAMGCAQMEQLDTHIEKKRRIAEHYTKALATIPGIKLMREAKWAKSIYWLYTILVDDQLFGMDNRKLLDYLASRNIQTRFFWQPNHLSTAHRGASMTDCPVSERLYRQGLSIPCSVGASSLQLEKVIDSIRAAFQNHHS